ncbi:MAG TPA: PQQ-dependent sugar dehydrogenase [Candidatus Limnocylindria bacterium]
MRRLPASTRTFASRLGVSPRTLSTVLLSGLLLLTIAGVVAAVRPFDPVRVEVVQAGLDHPWDIAFAADGRMLVTERAGRVRVFAGPARDDPLLHTATVPDVRAELESGLMGIAVHGTDVFVCASRDAGGDWKVELLHSTLADDGSLAAFTPLPIGEQTGEPTGGPRHQGCAVEVDATDHLWFSVGDANQPAGANVAQDPHRLNGKILRVKLDGSTPDDNPFGNEVFSLGHRNPQGLAFAADGSAWAVEHGTEENDEINHLRAGGNYGYPCFTGADTPGPIPGGCSAAAAYLPPAWASGSPTLATSGATLLAGSSWRDWQGDLMVSTLKEEDLRRFSVDGDTATLEETLLDGRFGRLRAMVIGPDGALYVSTANGGDDRILRVTR